MVWVEVCGVTSRSGGEHTCPGAGLRWGCRPAMGDKQTCQDEPVVLCCAVLCCAVGRDAPSCREDAAVGQRGGRGKWHTLASRPRVDVGSVAFKRCCLECSYSGVQTACWRGIVCLKCSCALPPSLLHSLQPRQPLLCSLSAPRSLSSLRLSPSLLFLSISPSLCLSVSLPLCLCLFLARCLCLSVAASVSV